MITMYTSGIYLSLYPSLIVATRMQPHVSTRLITSGKLIKFPLAHFSHQSNGYSKVYLITCHEDQMRNIESICTLRILCSKYTVTISCYCCCYYHNWFFRSTSLPLYVYSLKFCGQTSYFGMQFYLVDHTQHSCKNYLDLFPRLLLVLKPLSCFLSNFKPLEVNFSAYIVISNAYAAWSQGLYFFMIHVSWWLH